MAKSAKKTRKQLAKKLARTTTNVRDQLPDSTRKAIDGILSKVDGLGADVVKKAKRPAQDVEVTRSDVKAAKKAAQKAAERAARKVAERADQKAAKKERLKAAKKAEKKAQRKAQKELIKAAA
ncbi:MAG TPA: hypothetical protein VIJ51_06605 [Solirubrobacteraceae bacterium]